MGAGPLRKRTEERLSNSGLEPSCGLGKRGRCSPGGCPFGAVVNPMSPPYPFLFRLWRTVVVTPRAERVAGGCL